MHQVQNRRQLPTQGWKCRTNEQGSGRKDKLGGASCEPEKERWERVMRAGKGSNEGSDWAPQTKGAKREVGH